MVEVEAVQEGVLIDEGYTTFCIPGGDAKKYMAELGEKGKDAIQKFVQGGGGFVGKSSEGAERTKPAAAAAVVCGTVIGTDTRDCAPAPPTPPRHQVMRPWG